MVAFPSLSFSFSFLPRFYLNHYCVFRQISSKFSPSSKMGRNNANTRSSQPERLCDGGNSVIHKHPPIPDWQSFETSQDNERYLMVGSIPIIQFVRQNHSLPLPTRCNSSSDNQPECMSSSDHLPSTPTTTVSEHTKLNRRTIEEHTKMCFLDCSFNGKGDGSNLSFSSKNSSLSLPETSSTTKFTSHHDQSRQRSHVAMKRRFAFVNRPHTSHSNFHYAAACCFAKFKPYDICLHQNRNSALIGDSLFEKKEESCIELQEGGTRGRILRPGMVLLKHYITHNEQVEIVKICRKLGLGPGGFYQPGYADGAKLRLQMMCLGLDWDPQTRKYGNKRSIDGSKPPSIPHPFSLLVKRAIQEAHFLINKECGVGNVEDILPSVSPDVCIVNFYTTNGRLGLHKDRDESRESLRKGLPVVSFSVGDSAEFLYGDQRDVETAENVLLESGDVLIFGGESRHVFHGVSSIIPNSAPKELLKDTWLRPGRLNLTFRQY